MKFVATRAALLAAVEIADKIVPSKTPMDAMYCVKFIAQGGRVVVAARDSDAGVVAPVFDADPLNSGVALAKCDLILRSLKESGDEKYTVSCVDGRLWFMGDSSKFSVGAIDPELLTVAEPGKGTTNRWSIRGGSLKRGIGVAIPMVNTSDSNLSMTGVRFKLGDGQFGSIIGFSRNWGGVCDVAISPMDTPRPSGITISIRAASLIRAACVDDEIVGIVDDGVHLRFTMEKCEVWATPLCGAFPDLTGILKSCRANPFMLKVAPGMLRQAVRQAMVFDSKETLGVDFKISGDGVELSRQCSAGNASISVPSTEYSGDPVEITLDPTPLLSALGCMSGDVFLMRINGDGSPLCYTDDDGATFIHAPIGERG